MSEDPPREAEAEQTEDSRAADTGDQMPEEAPEGQTGSGDRADRDPGEASGAADAPSVTGGRGGGPDGAPHEGTQSTGNPHAAG